MIIICCTIAAQSAFATNLYNTNSSCHIYHFYRTLLSAIPTNVHACTAWNIQTLRLAVHAHAMSKTTPTYKNQQLVQGRQPHWGWQHEWSGRHVIQTILANHMLLSICLWILTYGLEALVATAGVLYLYCKARSYLKFFLVSSYQLRVFYALAWRQVRVLGINLIPDTEGGPY